METGSLAELISAFGSVLALVAAAIAARAAIRNNQYQAKQLSGLEERENRRADEARHNQAAKVCVWFGLRPENGETSIRYANTSRLPVYDSDIFVIVHNRLIEVSYGVVPPRSTTYYFDRVNEEIVDHFRRLETPVDGVEAADRGQISLRDFTARSDFET